MQRPETEKCFRGDGSRSLPGSLHLTCLHVDAICLALNTTSETLGRAHNSLHEKVSSHATTRIPNDTTDKRTECIRKGSVILFPCVRDDSLVRYRPGQTASPRLRGGRKVVAALPSSLSAAPRRSVWPPEAGAQVPFGAAGAERNAATASHEAASAADEPLTLFFFERTSPRLMLSPLASHEPGVQSDTWISLHLFLHEAAMAWCLFAISTTSGLP